MKTPALAVHGGAWDIPPEERAAHAEGCAAAASIAGAMLASGASALDAVCAAVESMEASGVFDAGRGAVLNAEGAIELDAGVMEGTTSRLGAVAACPPTPHPIRAARALLEDGETSILVGEGARAYAAALGCPFPPSAVFEHPRERARFERLLKDGRGARAAFGPPPSGGPRGTVGAAARDVRGGLAAAVSTGGVPLKRPGRVGDTPLPGCGYFADDASGAAACTGFGEAIMRLQTAARACERVASAGSADAAALEAVQALASRVGGLGGIAIVGPAGRPAARWNTPTMAFALWTPEAFEAGCP